MPILSGLGYSISRVQRACHKKRSLQGKSWNFLLIDLPLIVRFFRKTQLKLDCYFAHFLEATKLIVSSLKPSSKVRLAEKSFWSDWPQMLTTKREHLPGLSRSIPTDPSEDGNITFAPSRSVAVASWQRNPLLVFPNHSFGGP
mmetsp:Transcript_49483/g.120119  ORF Transcript_49483/g.120119 Transcript_49483/m.120119 type:complete len:143 (+) Transcript_49483:3022-3450(+)